MKESWEIRKGYRNYGVHVLEKKQIIIWESRGGNPHTEVGNTYNLEEFLEGNGQSFVQSNFGTVILEEVIASVKNKK